MSYFLSNFYRNKKGEDEYFERVFKLLNKSSNYITKVEDEGYNIQVFYNEMGEGVIYYLITIYDYNQTVKRKGYYNEYILLR